jgi:RNA polymerase sigma factor (sigma-70 family)
MNPNELFEEYYHLAEATVLKLFKNPQYLAKQKGLELEDLHQYAREGLWESALKFDSVKGNRSFQNFAITNIRWTLIKKIRKDCKKFTFRGTGLNPKEIESKTNFISFDSPSPVGNEEGSTYHELIAGDYNLEGEAIGNLLEDAIPPRTLQFLKLKMQGKTLNEIGKQFGISREAVRIDIKKFSHKLKEVI